jgi:hypothetical protein
MVLPDRGSGEMVELKSVGFIPCMILAAAVLPSLAQVAVNISGTVKDSSGAPIAGAAIVLETSGLTATSGSDGKFTVSRGTSAVNAGAVPRMPLAALHGGSLFLSVPEKSTVTITAFGLEGKALASLERRVDAGSHGFPLAGLPQAGSGVRFYHVKSGADEITVNAVSMEGALPVSAAGASRPNSGLAKGAAAAFYDVITVTKTGYLKSYLTVAVSELANADIRMLKTTSPKFSFFVTSMRGLQALSTANGFGGDFRFGETGPGSGLRGADKICATLAEKSMPGSANKGWRAFLSVTADAAGKQVNAIDRIGAGPWLDRTGRVMAPTKADLLAVRPTNGDPTIQLDLPNENGIPNHRPDPTKPEEDNHHTITGSDAAGKLKSATATCKDWTTSDGASANGKPSAGFAWPRGGKVGSSGSNWMTTWDAPGCAAGIEITDGGGAPAGSVIIGGGGGYGGFYCFALNP